MERAAELVRRGWEAALSGDLETVAGLLADDVRWHAAGHEDAGCQDRAQVLRWMRQALERGGAEVSEVRALDAGRVLVVLRRRGAPDAHAQVVHVRDDGKISRMVVYPTPAEALAA